jgi:hypothetical protein
MALGGRPKEQGGHKPLKISVDKFVAEALEKVGNKSQFIESVAYPVLKKLDPGEASVFLWEIDAYISQHIKAATNNRNFEQVQALSWLADQLEDARKLCGNPPSNYNAPFVESEVDREKAIYRLNSFEAMTGYEFSRIERDYVLNQNDGKRMLDKAEALVSLRRKQALL